VRAPNQVETFVVTPPSRPHVDIGMLQVIRHSGDESFDQMLALLRTAAAQHGCDALLVTSVDTRALKYSSGSIVGSCEVFTDVQSAPPAAPLGPPRGPILPSGPAGTGIDRSWSAPGVCRRDGQRQLVVAHLSPRRPGFTAFHRSLPAPNRPVSKNPKPPQSLCKSV
jgi:hypothetical protein